MRFFGAALLFVASTAVAETNQSGPPLGPVTDEAADSGIIGGTQTTVVPVRYVFMPQSPSYQRLIEILKR